MIATSQPLFGPCVPSSLTGPSATHVTKTPTRTEATAIRLASRHVAARSRRTVGSLMGDDATTGSRRAQVRRGARSPDSCSRRSLSSSTGRCSGSRSGRVGRRRPTRSPRRARRRRPRRSSPAAAPPARCGAAVRLVDRRDDRAVGRGRQLLPADLRGRRSGASRPCTSSCSAGARARSGWRWPRSCGASWPRASR